MLDKTYSKTGTNKAFIQALLGALIVIFFTVTYFGIERYGENLSASRTETMRLAIEKAAVQCYALEGQYPPNVKYLERHYGIKLNEEEYLYEYLVFSSNIRPSILVIQRGNRR